MIEINKYCCRMWMCLSLAHRGYGSCVYPSNAFWYFHRTKESKCWCAGNWSQHSCWLRFHMCKGVCVYAFSERDVVREECHCAYALANVCSCWCCSSFTKHTDMQPNRAFWPILFGNLFYLLTALSLRTVRSFVVVAVVFRERMLHAIEFCVHATI